jgi:1,4-dihydroxy-2-naphthoate octaprenyltransferase
MSRTRTLVAATRPPFLLLAPVTVLCGLASAVHDGIHLQWQFLLLALLGALAAHVAVNTLNEYQDFRSGLDALTHRTPFSGGSGALPTDPGGARGVLLTALTAVAVTLVIGLYLAWLRGPAIVAVGLAGLAIILGYTRWLNRDPWLCLAAPGVGFGLMVIGTHLALGGRIDGTVLLAALVVSSVASNLLLLNQYPDMDADRAVGRHTFPIVYGIGRSNLAYAVLLATTALLLFGAVQERRFPPLSLAASLPLLAGLAALFIANRQRGEAARLLPALGLNVATALLTPALLGATLWLG